MKHALKLLSIYHLSLASPFLRVCLFPSSLPLWLAIFASPTLKSLRFSLFASSLWQQLWSPMMADYLDRHHGPIHPRSALFEATNAFFALFCFFLGLSTPSWLLCFLSLYEMSSGRKKNFFSKCIQKCKIKCFLITYLIRLLTYY